MCGEGRWVISWKLHNLSQCDAMPCHKYVFFLQCSMFMCTFCVCAHHIHCVQWLLGEQSPLSVPQPSLLFIDSLLVDCNHHRHCLSRMKTSCCNETHARVFLQSKTSYIWTQRTLEERAGMPGRMPLWQCQCHCNWNHVHNITPRLWLVVEHTHKECETSSQLPEGNQDTVEHRDTFSD